MKEAAVVNDAGVPPPPPPQVSTKGPMWWYPRLVLGALGSFLEPFCGHLLPKVDRLCSKLTFEIPPQRALRGTIHCVGGGHPIHPENVCKNGWYGAQ